MRAAEAPGAQALAAQFADLLDAGDILVGARLAARHPGYCAHSLDGGVLLRPKSTAQLAAICRRAHAAGWPIVPHGGLTGLVDGTASRPGELIVSFENMRRVLCIDARQGVVTVEAGLTLQALDEALAEHAAMIGVDIPSRGSCTVGGMIATNAGGARVLRYGMMRHAVLGLEAVLADGEVLDLMRPLLKNNAGYDLAQLFIGSEGTLGLVTRAQLRLWPRPRRTATALLACASEAQLMALFVRARAELGPALLSFEAMWPGYYELTGSQPGSGARPLPLGAAVYAVVEVAATVDGDGPAALLRTLEAAQAAGELADAALARSEAEREAIWRLREDSDAVGRRHRGTLTYDIGVRLDDLGRFVGAAAEALRRDFPDATPYFFGHVGDGNLHVMLGLDDAAPERGARFDERLYGLVAGFEGSTISAEHGIGLGKREYLRHSASGPALALMRTLKRALDPKNILNPGKVVDLR